jgi:sulfite exporter TauE/SafE
VEAQFAAAFLIGLLGGVHCVGMCGGIVGALVVQMPGRGRAWGLHLTYSAGRIASYSVAGAMMGLVGSAGLFFDQVLPVQLLLYVFANLLLIVLGLYLAGVGGLLLRLEALGGWMWRRIQPYSARVLPADTLGKAFALGAIWGWLPCGLVYSLLATAMLSGGAGSGSLVMLAFGVGTLPNLLLAGMVFKRLRDITSDPRVRMAAGALVAGFGIVGLVKVSDMSEHIRRGLLCIT